MKMLSILVSVLFLLVSSLGAVEDQVNLEEAVHHVENLVAYSPRLAGSGTVEDTIIGGVHSAGLYIAETLKKYGYDVHIEEFPFTTYQITEFILVIDFDGDFSTPDQLDLSEKAIPPTVRHADITHDVTAPLVLVEESVNIAGIPVFEYWLYYDPEYSDIVGHFDITLVYKKDEPAFTGHFREAFSISYQDYIGIKEQKTDETVVWVKFSSYSKEVTGYNVVGIKKGDTLTNKKVILSAHYDSVYTDGAIDNGSGVAALLETARILSGKQVGAAVYFIFFDAEEIGLLGSEAFVAAHDLLKCVCINVDSIASGDTVYIGGVPRYEEMWAPHFFTDPYLDSYISGIAESVLGYKPEQWVLEDVGGYSDFVSFTEQGIPATDITTMDKEATKIPAISEEKLSDHSLIWMKGGKTIYYQEDRFNKVIPYIHTYFDDLDHFDKEIFYDSTRVVVKAAYQLSIMSEEHIESAHVVFIGLVAVMVVVIWYVVKPS
ncbi:MAG: Zn-dependent exopeptidase M28 [Theionarchaea archaeon]|nr:Zn-dependent exopeptidase M28 [Theionarchaea archaeon]